MKRFWLVISLCSVFMVSFLTAAEEQRHVPVGERAEPAETAVDEAKRREMAAANLCDGQQLPKDKGVRKANAKAVAKSLYAPTVLHTSHPDAYQHIFDLTHISVELEDGSIWVHDAYDSATTMGWLPNDVIVITPNSIFSPYSYRLTNQKTGTAIVANLSMGPLYNGPMTHWIQAIDYYNNVIYLEDGSLWKMSSFDCGIISRWMLNDTVIIGVNNGWLSSVNPNILINVNMLNYATGISY